MSKTVERIVNAERVEDLIAVFGSFDENIKRIEDSLGVQVINRGTDLRVIADEEQADKAVDALTEIIPRLRSMSPLYEDFVKNNP